MANPGAGLWDVILTRATVASVVVDAHPEETSAGHHASLHIRPYVTLLQPNHQTRYPNTANYGHWILRCIETCWFGYTCIHGPIPTRRHTCSPDSLNGEGSVSIRRGGSGQDGIISPMPKISLACASIINLLTNLLSMLCLLR